jgi:hypothetical protein
VKEYAPNEWWSDRCQELLRDVAINLKTDIGLFKISIEN